MNLNLSLPAVPELVTKACTVEGKAQIVLYSSYFLFKLLYTAMKSNYSFKLSYDNGKVELTFTAPEQTEKTPKKKAA